MSDIEIPELLWQMVEEGIKAGIWVCWHSYAEGHETQKGTGCSLRRAKHTVYQDHKKCAGVSIISIIKVFSDSSSL